MRITAKFSYTRCALTFICIVFTGSLMAFQLQEWEVQYTATHSQYNQKNNWNAGRLNSRNRRFNEAGELGADFTDSVPLNEVTLGDPGEDTTYQPIVWHVLVKCREGSENGGDCKTETDNLRGGTLSGNYFYLYFKTKDDAVAFVNFFRK